MGSTDQCLQAVFAEHELSRLLSSQRKVKYWILCSFPIQIQKAFHPMYTQQPQLPANQHTQCLFRRENNSLGWRLSLPPNHLHRQRNLENEDEH